MKEAEEKNEVESCARPNPHIGSCGGCFFAGQHIDRLHDLIMEAAPLTWAAASSTAEASEWEKRATDLMSHWRIGAEPKEERQPSWNHPGKVAEFVPKFADSVWYYLRELIDGDQPWHVIGHIQELCKEFDAAVKAEFDRLRAEEAAAKAVVK